ncbi:uncharacterized protein LOC129768413 isoform X2 [Toxorhynchites rutilus septentrionalis]|uniref:uncharacterized protein LOC129768413 isoform X2 n=1 Tax=Toxorhynchites rutilus septentrionalis TaxID=329112 RepID=UPI00247A3B6B|nr:uncharacterized protein LOC129768413 isoform X2 [Toxorhynchites rutilus septentrionalis]
MLKHVLKSSSTIRLACTGRRTFLSDAYPCREAWQARLTTPILAKVDHEALYFELEQKFQHKNKVSAIDIDIYANKLEDDSHMDEMADLMYKFRLTEETTNGLDSTQHAIARNYIEHSHYSELIELLNNRIAYGVYLDDFTANLALNRLITTNEFKWAARIATLLGLQEDFSNPITRSLSLYACYRYVKGGSVEHFDDLVPPAPVDSSAPKKSKKKDEIKDSKLLLGKTFYLLGLNSGEGVVGNSSRWLGLVLHEKYDKAVEVLEANQKSEFSGEIASLVETFLENVEDKENEQYKKLIDAVGTLKVVNDSFEKMLLDDINKSVAENEKSLIDEQKKIYNDWSKLRQQRLEEELARLHRVKRIQEMERTAREMEQEEQKLWFFENEDKIDLQIDSKKVFYPKRWFGKKKKPRVVNEGYIPPEIRQRYGQR